MLDIGWSEMAIVAVVALFVIGPRELPRLLRTVGRYAAKIRGMAREFQEGIDDAVREAELDEVKKQIESVRKIDVRETARPPSPGRAAGMAASVAAAAAPAPAPAAEPGNQAEARPPAAEAQTTDA